MISTVSVVEDPYGKHNRDVWGKDFPGTIVQRRTCLTLQVGKK